MAEKLEIIIGAKDQFSETFGKLRGSLPSLKTLAVGTGAALAGIGASLFAISKSTATAHDRVGKFASRIGVSAEALSKYHVAAEFSGVKTEALNTSWQRMARRIAEASQGTGTATKALEALNLSAANLAGLSPDKQFEAIAGAMEGVTNQGQKMQIAMQLWDTEGVAMLQMLTGGTKGLKEMTAEAEKFGLVVSAKAAANAAAFNDSLTRVTGSMKGLKNTIAEELLPTIAGLSNHFADFMVNNRELVVQFAETFLTAMGHIVGKGVWAAAALVDGWRNLEMTWEALKIGFAEFSKVIWKGIDLLVGKMVELTEAFNFMGIYDDAIDGLQAFRDMNQENIRIMGAMADEARKNLTSMQDEMLAVDKVDAYAAKIKGVIAEIRAAGTASTGEGSAEAARGIPPFTDANLAKARENIDANAEIQALAFENLRLLHDEYFLSESERLDAWYLEEQAKFTGNQEALTLLAAIYARRQTKIEDLEQKQREKNKAKSDATRTAMQGKFYTDLNAIGQIFGAKGVAIAKAMSIPQAIMSTYTGAANALASLPFPANIAAALAVVATGIGSFLPMIQGQSYHGVAHGGLGYVPREQTYLLDRGERVLSPSQNRDLTEYMAGSGGGGDIYIEAFNVEIEVLPNATNFDAFLRMSESEMTEIVADKVIPALRQLDGAGIRP